MGDLLDLRFLVVDDMFTMRKMMTRTLSTFGIKSIVEAKDGKIASDLLRLEAAKGTPFHFIVSDWNMPEMSGLELLAYCRSNEAFKNVGFILVTAEADAAQAEKAKSIGVDHYFLKPIEDQAFREVLTSVYMKRFSKK